MQLLLNEYPRCNNWARWWMAPEQAQMLFQSELAMDPSLASRVPDTTNPEEALHNKIYQLVGKDHSVMQGIHALRQFSAMISHEYDATHSQLLFFISYTACDTHKMVCSRNPNSLWMTRAMET